MGAVLEKAMNAWQGEMPDWVRVLAEEADRTSQNKAAKRIGRTSGLVSQVLSNSYGAKLDMVEEIVRGALMSETVECPGFGEPIKLDTCQMWRKRATKFSGHNALRRDMYRACSRCDRFREVTQS